MSNMHIANTEKFITLCNNDPAGWLVSLSKALEEDLGYHKRIGQTLTQEELREAHGRLSDLAIDLLMQSDGRFNPHAIQRMEDNGFVVFRLADAGELVIHTRHGNLHLPLEAA